MEPAKTFDPDFLRLASLLEEGLPIAAEPFGRVAEALGISEEAAAARARSLALSPMSRRFGVFVDLRACGYEGYLFGVRVPIERLSSVVGRINAMSRVTHNYIRDHRVNVWFTAAMTGDDSARELGGELRRANLDFVSLAVRRMIKLRPSFASNTVQQPPVKDAVPLPSCTPPPVELSEFETAILRELCRDFPITPRPYAIAASRLGLGEEALISCVKRLKALGVIRRIGIALNHTGLGWRSNALMAWDMSGLSEEEILESADAAALTRRWVSHCYIRHAVECSISGGWDYNLYMMVHAFGPDELSARERELADVVGGCDFVSLRTTEEQKKISFIPEKE
jgi:DNA-binding Lrp family transcriptional regulator